MGGEKELYPGFAGDLAKHQEREAELARAATAALPGPLREAFAGEPLTVCGVKLRQVECGDFILLTQLENYTLELARTYFELGLEAAGEATAKAQERIRRQGESDAEMSGRIMTESAEMFYLLAHPRTECRKLLAAGRAAYREAALQFVDGLPLTAVALIPPAIIRALQAGFATAVEYEAERSNDGSFQLPPAESKTDSAGG